MKNAAALILLNGEMNDPRAVRAAARSARAVVCADGGARHAQALGIVPDFVVGDMDSLSGTFPRSWKRVAFLCDFDPERSDLDKALALAREIVAARRVLVAGVRGGSLDHDLVNFAALEDSAKGFELSVIDDGTARLLGRGRHRLTLKKGARFSLLAAPRARLSLSGARYGLNDETLLRGSRGLGNRADHSLVELVVREGRVWVIDSARFRG